MKLSKEFQKQILETPGVKVGPSAVLPPLKKAKARYVPGDKNGLEQAYEDTVLKPSLAAGEILGYWFEPVKLRLGDRCYYTPDWLVVLKDGTLEFRENKATWKQKGGGERAGWKDDSRVKIKVAAERYPVFGFLAASGKKRAGVWEWKEERL